MKYNVWILTTTGDKFFEQVYHDGTAKELYESFNELGFSCFDDDSFISIAPTVIRMIKIKRVKSQREIEIEVLNKYNVCYEIIGDTIRVIK